MNLSEIMKPCIHVDKDQRLSYAVELFEKHTIARLPVMDEGALVGIIAGRSTGGTMVRPVLALLVGIATIVIGYFVFEAFIYPLLGKTIPFFKVTTVEAALAEIFPNLMQGVISALITVQTILQHQGLGPNTGTQ